MLLYDLWTAGHNAGLGGCRAGGIGAQAVLMHAAILNGLTQFLAGEIVADDASQENLGVQRASVDADIGRATGDDAFLGEFQNEYGSLARDAGGATDQVFVGDHIADDQYTFARKCLYD